MPCPRPAKKTEMSLKKLLLPLAAVVIAAENTNAQTVALPGWDHHMLIAFPGCAGTSTLTNFPALIRLDKDITRAMLENGEDLLFTDMEENVLPHEMDTWDTNGVSLAWVRVPLLDNTATIMAHWGNPAPPPLPPGHAADTWAQNFLLVQHFSETNGMSVADATAANRTATIVNGANGTADGGVAPGVAGNAIDLSSNASRESALRLDNEIQLGSAWTFSAWFKGLQHPDSGNNNAWRTLMRGNASAHHVIVEYNSDKLGAYQSSTQFTQAGGALLEPDNPPEWRHITAVGTGSATLYYVDGKPPASGAAITTDTTLRGIGGYQGSGSDSPSQKFADFLDEVRVANVARSTDWVKAEHDTVASPGFAALFPLDGSLPPADVVGARDVQWTNAVVQGLALGAPLTVCLVWDTEDAPLQTNLWANVSEPVTVSTPGVFAVALEGLQPGTNYFARLVVEDGVGGLEWIEPCVEFATWEPLRLAFVQNAGEEDFVPGIVAVHRGGSPAETSRPLDVNYTFTGVTAVEGVNYAAPSGKVTIPAGASSAEIHVIPLVDVGSSGATTLEVAMDAGPYAYDPAPVPVTIAKWDLGAQPQNIWIAPGSSGDASVASNWTKGVPKAGDDILLLGVFSNADMTWDCDGVNTLAHTVASWTQSADYTGTVTFNTQYPEAPGAVFTNFMVAGDVEIAGGAWTHPANGASEEYRLRVTVGNDFTLAAGAQINVREKGYAAGQFHPESALGIHGGSRNNFAEVYGDLKEPVNLGSGGGASGTPSYAGGGAFYLVAGGTALVDGVINAGTFPGGGVYDNHNGGAGGSVYIRAGAVNGSGMVYANGLQRSGGAASSGGRVALVATNAPSVNIPIANLFARGNTGNYGLSAAAGTVFLQALEKPNGTLLVDNQFDVSNNSGFFLPSRLGTTCIPAGETWTLDEVVTRNYGTLSIPVGTTLELPNGFASVRGADTLRRGGILHLGGEILLGGGLPHLFQNNCVFFPAVPFTLDGDVIVAGQGALGTLPFTQSLSDHAAFNLAINGSLTVEAGGAITGVLGGLENDASPWAVERLATHGGQPGEYNDARAYGSILNPVLPGNFGSNFKYTSRDGHSPGGGALILNVSGDFVLDGTVDASAYDLTFAQTTAGSAGSVNITAATLAGSGSINASGYRQQNNTDKFGGGPGRVAVRLTGSGADFTAFGAANVHAHGFSENDANRADRMTSAGTVYLETAEDGENGGTILIWNDGNANNNLAFTPFPSPTDGGENDDFTNARLDIGQCARVKLFASVRMRELHTRENTWLDLNGETLVVHAATIGGQRVNQTGKHSASALQAMLGLDDATITDSLGGGCVELRSTGTVFMIK